jgi:CBS domain-containing protein
MAPAYLRLSHGIKGINNTYTRFKQLAINDPKYSEICLKLNFIKTRTVEGLKNEDSGQFINWRNYLK